MARAGIREALAADAGFDVCAEAANAEDAVELARRLRADLCLLDVRMPGNGIRAAAEIRSQVPDAAVVMLTVSCDDADLFDALRAGAAGYLLKDIDPVRLPRALRGVIAGEAALPRALVARLIDEFRDRGQRVRVASHLGVELTARQWEVLHLMRDGLSTAEMAERLFVSPVTVRRHVSAILERLQVPDRRSAVRALDEF